MFKTRSLLALLVGCVCALGVGGTAASAADLLPTKAPPPAAPPPSDWSAFAAFNYDIGQVNPQGQAVYKEGDYNFVGGAHLTLYSNKSGFINNWTIGGLGIIDFTSSETMGPSDSLWASFNPSQGGSQLYSILAGEMSVGFAEHWTLTDTFFHFDGGTANGSVGHVCAITTGVAAGAPLGCENLPEWQWNELKLSFADGPITHWAISFNPYVTMFTAIYPSGFTGVLGTTTSPACFSCNEESTDFILGMTPTLGMQPYWHVPVTLTAPTWITVGSKSFWAGNSGTGPGSGCPGFDPMAPNCSSGNVGVFTTGLTATWALTSIPVQYGHWAVKAGFQWYDIVNKALQYDNEITYGAPSASGNLMSSITTGTVGIVVGF